MKIFISWSGDKSKNIAEALYEWLPNVIQGLEPWISVNDIEKGTVWRSEVSSQLEAASVGIICLTSDNLEKPWLLFEAGAISKKLNDSYVCTYLFGIEPSDVKDPLAQFQSTRANKEDTHKLLLTINQAQGEKSLSKDRIDKSFDKWWPELEQKLKAVPDQSPHSEILRTDREILQEILLSVRHLMQNSQDQAVFMHDLLGADDRSTGKYSDEIRLILDELKRRKRGLLHKSLTSAKHIEFRDGKLVATYSEYDLFARRVNDSASLFAEIGVTLFGVPILIEVKCLNVADFIHSKLKPEF